MSKLNTHGYRQSNVTILANEKGVREVFKHAPGQDGNMVANREALAAKEGWQNNAPHLAEGLYIVDCSTLTGYNGPVFTA